VPERQLTDLVQWQELPPTLNVLRVPILSPKPGESHRVVIVCNDHALVDTHFIRERTTACVGRANNCEGCLEQARKVRKLYFGAWYPGKDRLYAAELPSGAIPHVWLTVDKYRGKLRGWVLVFGRPSKHKTGRVQAMLRPMDQFERREWRLPGEFNLKESLAQVWVNLRVPPPAPEDGREGEVPT
jgi:hypothetical protein